MTGAPSLYTEHARECAMRSAGTLAGHVVERVSQEAAATQARAAVARLATRTIEFHEAAARYHAGQAEKLRAAVRPQSLPTQHNEETHVHG